MNKSTYTIKPFPAYQQATDVFADIQSCEAYTDFHAYSRSKYLNLLWTFALARRLEGSGVIANALHPGTAWTAITRNSEPRSFPATTRPLWSNDNIHIKGETRYHLRLHLKHANVNP
jgi:NAD(P)-dependent dehydrogenase (short-subunit alcohol dehydrogenase family)